MTVAANYLQQMSKAIEYKKNKDAGGKQPRLTAGEEVAKKVQAKTETSMQIVADIFMNYKKLPQMSTLPRG